MDNTTHFVTQLLKRVAANEPRAHEDLYRRVYSDLELIARRKIYETNQFGLVDSRAIVNEAFVRMFGKEGDYSANRKVFFTFAASVMRGLIVDLIRESASQKRGGAQQFTALRTELNVPAENTEKFSSLLEAVEALYRHDARAGKLVDLRFFGGFTLEECADQLEISIPTASRDWERARVFLETTITGQKAPDSVND